MKNETKAVYLLERTKDLTSNIIGFYSSEELAIAAVKRHVIATIDGEIARAHKESGLHTGLYIQEGFLISKNEVEVDEDVAFDKIEDPEEFHSDLSDQDIQYHPAEDLGDVKDPIIPKELQ